MTDEHPLIVDRDRPGLAVVRLNRPEHLNAMSVDLMEALVHTLEDLARDVDVRCVAVTGEGRAFCAGGDVDRISQRPSEVDELAPWLDHRIAALKEVQRSSLLLHTMRKPTVALVNGAAVGGGMSLALACDFRIASSAARFGTAYARMAISTDFGMSYFLPLVVGQARARELLMFPDLLDAEQAGEIGLVTRVVSEDDFSSDGMAFCETLADGPTVAYGRIKDNLILADHATVDVVMEREAENARMAGLFRDSREAVAAFQERRTPRFEGR